MLSSSGNALRYRFDAEQVSIEPWGPNALRVRATKLRRFPDEDWALESAPARSEARVEIADEGGTVTNGKIRASITRSGKLRMWNQQGKLLLEEHTRHRRDVLDEKCSALDIEAREFKAITGTDSFHLTMRLESVDDEEKLFGMGQYQQPHLNLKGHDLELAHRNSQASVPFVLSSLGYGLLWNNPSIGRAVLGYNAMTFEAYSTTALDYWVVAGDTPAEVTEAYADATGKVPMMPEYGLGFWQCKLRYQTQDELLQVAREYRRRQLPIDLIVVDFFHWPRQGDWRFDEQYWPDPTAMVRELRELNIELMVSVWPTVDKRSENYDEMVREGHLIQADRGVRTAFDFEGDTVHVDVTSPEARRYLWEACRRNYYRHGIQVFWLDEAEPEYSRYDFDNYRYRLGSNLGIGNVYPREYSRAFHEGLMAENGGNPDVVNLVRCAWAGSQKFGALVWSGDIASSWSSLRNQLAAGLHMGLSGLPWWTTDIGGFHGGDPDDEGFRELLVRWFQWGAFCPVMRLHGDREPRQEILYEGATYGATCRSGAANEVWSFGEEVYGICRKYMGIREDLRGYTRGLMREAHEKGSPLMRPLFYEFPDDKRCWEVKGQYMYGDKYLVCPVMNPGVRKMKVYLPRGAKWKLQSEDVASEGGVEREVECPLDTMPVFEKTS